MRQTLTIALILFVSILGYSQSTIILSSQEEVDAFDPTTTSLIDTLVIQSTDSTIITDLSNLSNLTYIGGDLIIKDNPSANLNGLNAFSNLTTIGGALEINNNNGLSQINGLSNLTSIGKDVIILENYYLAHLDGLSGITSIKESLVINNNSSMLDIDGLSNVTSIGAFLRIIGGTFLLNIDGLSNLTSIAGYVTIFDNPKILNLDALSGVTSLGGHLLIQRNEKLANINGLSNLTSIGKFLTIRDNAVLQNLDPLSNLTIINGHVWIKDNGSLTDLNGLSNVTSIGGYLSIDNNNSLNHITGLSNVMSVGDFITIKENSKLTNIDPLSNLTIINGHLWIADNWSLTQIDALSNVTSIGGYLSIDNNNGLTEINALSNITSIGGYLTIADNNNLQSLDPLLNLTTINGHVLIKGNGTLTDLNGLSNITTIGDYLSIDDNDGLTNLDDLSNLTSIGNGLVISGNGNLLNLNGLSGVSSFGGGVEISNNFKLTEVDVLSFVNGTISGDLTIRWNSQLMNVDGLSSVTAINGNLTIQSNGALTEIDGFSDVVFVGNDLLVNDNSNLSDCCGIQDLLENPSWIAGSAYIYGNPFSCNDSITVVNTDCGIAFNVIAFPPCIGADNGALEIDVNNFDLTPFVYAWENTVDGTTGSGTSTDDIFTIGNLTEGIYNVTVTAPVDDKEVRTEIVMTAVDGSIFEIIELTTTNSSNELANGAITVGIAGGTAPYSYTWSGPASGSVSGEGDYYTIPDLRHGEYYIVVSDSGGAEQSISVSLLDETVAVFPCTEPLDIVILNDVSGSVDGVEYFESKEFFVDFLEEINIGSGPDDSRAAIIEWSDGQNIRIQMTGDLPKLQEYNTFTRAFSGGTNPQSAMVFGEDYLSGIARPDVERILVLSTDGSQGQVAPSLVALADEFKAAGYHIVTIAFDDAFSDPVTRERLRQVASIDLLAPGAPAYSLLDEALAENIVNLFVCPVDPGSTATAYFNRDGAIDIIDVEPVGFCPFPESVEITFTVEALRELSVPSGMPVSFYHNNPETSGGTFLLTWQIPCAIPAGTTETFTITLPISSPTNIYAVLNDDGSASIPISLPITAIEELAYSNNIDNIAVCVDPIPTLQAIKRAVTYTPICNNTIMYEVDVCNIGSLDAVGVTVADIAPPDFVFVGSIVNTNGCAIENTGSFDIPAGCCVTITYSYDASAAPLGFYNDQDVDIGGPGGQVYYDFDGSKTTAEDVLLDGTVDCPSTFIGFSKSVSVTESCEDAFVTYTFTIENQTNIPLFGLEFTDILPDPVTWTYEPYGLSGLSIGSAPLSGTDAIFTIDVVEADTIASFSIDAYLGDWFSDGTLDNSATLDNIPDLNAGGYKSLISNLTTTDVFARPGIILPDTITVFFYETEVSLEAILGEETNIQWTTTGDGSFSDPNTASTVYTIGEGDIANGEVGLFMETSSDCGEDGASVVVIIENPCGLTIDELATGFCNNGGTNSDSSDDTYRVDFTISAVNPGPAATYTVTAGTDVFGPFAYGSDESIMLPADGNVYTLIFADTNDPACIFQVEVSQFSCSCISGMDYHIEQPVCPEDLTGTFVIDSLYGGMNENLNYSFDGLEFFPFSSQDGISSNIVEGIVVGEHTMLIMEGDNPNCVYQVTFTIEEPFPFFIEAGEDTTIHLGETVPLMLQSSIPIDQLNWTWNDSTSLTCADCIDPIAFPLITTNYVLEATSPEGCVAKDIFTITVLEDYDLYIPNAFSPNGDRYNDMFSVYPGRGIEEILFVQVYDRWGELVYDQGAYIPSGSSAVDVGWDGLFNGKLMNPGVFVYSVEFRLVNGKVIRESGDVTLLR